MHRVAANHHPVVVAEPRACGTPLLELEQPADERKARTHAHSPCTQFSLRQCDGSACDADARRVVPAAHHSEACLPADMHLLLAGSACCCAHWVVVPAPYIYMHMHHDAQRCSVQQAFIWTLLVYKNVYM